MITSKKNKNNRVALRYVSLISPAILLAVGCSCAAAGQLPASAFQTYNPANASTIQAGPLALYSVPVNTLLPTQQNEGFSEVGKKTAGFDLLTPSQLPANLLTDIEPVVIGPGGKLYLTDGHHTFTALEDSIYGASNPTVYVNVIANFSNLTTAQFFATMQSQNLLLPLNNGVPQTVNTATGAPLPSSLTGLTNDIYRGLEYSILKNKSSKLFTTTANITGAVGSKVPGLDKMTGFYEDFFEAAAYRNANGGRGLPVLSPGDVALSTQWNLNPASKTTLPNVAGTVTAAQLPGFILAQSYTFNNVISNATLANGAVDGNGTFTGLTTINAGTAANPITIGTPNTGFVMQVGADKGFSVTLNGANTYTGGTSLLAGTLVIKSDASLGLAATGTIDPNNVKTSTQAANGIIFNSLTEGNATLQLGTASGGGTTAFALDRTIAVGGEAATINVNGYLATLTGQIVSLGVNNIGIGNATGFSDLTIDDTGSKGVLTLATASPNFYGNLIIGNTNAPTVKVMNDAALGNTTGNPASIGQIDLNSGTLQAGASFNASERNIFLGSGSTFDVNGFNTSWGTLTDVQRTLTIKNSNTTTAGSATFNNLTVGATAIVQMSGGAAGETVNLTNGIVRQGNAALVLQGTSGTSLGTTEKVMSGTGTASLVNGIAPAWIVTNGSTSNGAGPYDFVTYGANGYVKATSTPSLTIGTTLTGANNTSVVNLGTNYTATGNVATFALNTEGKNIALGTNTLTLGNGTNAAGLILANNTAITGGTLALGGSEGVVWLSGTSTIGSAITGTNGLTFTGSGAVTLSGTANVSGPLSIDSGTVTLGAANLFANNVGGITLYDTKTKPAAATLGITADNTLTTLNSTGNNSKITLGSGAALTLGDTTNNLSSTISSTLTETGAARTGALTLNGSGLFDLSGATVTLVSGSTIAVNNTAQFRVAAGTFGASNFGVTLNNSSELQFAQNGGGVFANQVTGTGDIRLIGGTLQITGTNNTYSGGTFLETGSVLDITTANLPAVNPNITNAGGLVVFDQATNGTYAGVISDGKQMGVGSVLSGSLDKDDSTGGNSGNVTFTKAQTFTGATTIEAGTITLNAVDTLATSSSVDLGRVGGGATATLALGANNTIQGLNSEAGNTTTVSLGANTLTINDAANTATNFGGSITGTGGLVKTGAGTQILSGTNSYTGTTSVNGGLLMAGAANAFSANSTMSIGANGALSFGTFAQTINNVALAGGTIGNGALTGAITSTGGTIDTLSGSASVTTTAGVTTLVNTDSYTGATNVNGGVLNVQGTLTASNVTVTNGGVLTGSGTISDPTIGAGGILAPGAATNAPTTLTMGGPLIFAPGSFYNVIVTPTASDRTTVTGTTTINGGTVQVMAAGTTFLPQTTYTILSSAGGVTGKFVSTTSNLAFLTPTLSYDPTDVFLTLSRNDVAFASVAGTQNERGIAIGLGNSPKPASANGAAILNAVASLSAPQARAAFDDLSGEGIAAAQNAAHRSVSEFTSAILDQTTFFTGNNPANSVVVNDGLPSGVLGYAARAESPIHLRDPAPAANTWRAWATGFGGTDNYHGDAGFGTAGQTSTIYGGALGVDYQLTPNYRAGIAIGGSEADFQVAGRSTSGSTSGGHIAFYDLATFGAFYGATTNSFSYFTNKTTRNVFGFAGLAGETDRGTFDSHEFRSHIEFGRHFDYLGGTFTPFIALEIAELRSNGFTETAFQGAGLGALSVSGQSSASVPGFIGGRYQGHMEFSGMSFTPSLQLAYVHEFAPERLQIGQLTALPGSTFLVNGARPDTNAVQIKLGTELALGRNSALFASFDSEIAGKDQFYAGKGGFRYSW